MVTSPTPLHKSPPLPFHISLQKIVTRTIATPPILQPLPSSHDEPQNTAYRSKNIFQSVCSRAHGLAPKRRASCHRLNIKPPQSPRAISTHVNSQPQNST
ncbi:MAG: hypothetical protein NZM04_04195 [Methylacidiphilales bacterium]|nr:hypothetical protein [Candidatus Methylacidiphilales bacterium]